MVKIPPRKWQIYVEHNKEDSQSFRLHVSKGMATQHPTQREFLRLAIPNMLAAIAVPMTQLADLAFLGHLENVTPLSGVVLATLIFDYLFWSFAFLRVGTTGLVAQAVGRNDKQEEVALFWRPIIIALIVGVAITAFQSPISDFSFAILSGGDVVEAEGIKYFNSHVLGAIPVMLNLAIIGWLLGLGKSGTVLILHSIWQASNIALNYVFIIEMDMGAYGAGLGTALAEWISLLVAVIAIYKCYGSIPNFNWNQISNPASFKKLLTLNSAIMVRTMVLMTVLGAFTNITATFGAVSLAANALLMKMFIFYAFMCDGYAIALETLAGQAEGKQDHSQLKRALKLSLAWAVGTGVAFVILYTFFAEPILSLITEHSNIIIAALPYTAWINAVILVGGVAFVYDGLYYGMAQPRLLARSMIVASLAFIPLAYYAWSIQSTHWLWAAFLLFTIIRALLLVSPARKIVR